MTKIGTTQTWTAGKSMYMWSRDPSQREQTDLSYVPQRCLFIAQVSLNLHFDAAKSKTMYIPPGLSPAWLIKPEVNRANLLIEHQAHPGNSMRHLHDCSTGVTDTQTDTDTSMDGQTLLWKYNDTSKITPKLHVSKFVLLKECPLSFLSFTQDTDLTVRIQTLIKNTWMIGFYLSNLGQNYQWVLLNFHEIRKYW